MATTTRPASVAHHEGPGSTDHGQIAVGRTIVDLFRDHVDRFGDRPALRIHRRAGWEAISWREYGDTVDRVTAGLAALGVEPGARVGLLSSNRPEWHQADLGVLAAGGVTVPVYPTNAASQVAYVLGHSRSEVCFVENRDQLAKVLLRRDGLPHLRRIVLFDGMDGLDDPLVLDFAQLLDLGERHRRLHPELLAERAAAVTPASLATIVYTSGTTGPPKGAMISHRNIEWTIRAVTAIVPIGPDDRFLSFLPLSHIAERTVSHFGQIVAGGETWFARSLVTVAEDLRACRPTIFFAVPRVWEKFHEAILEELHTKPPVMGRLVDRLVHAGEARVDAVQAQRRISLRDWFEWQLLDRSIGALLRRKLGLDRARVLVSGAAPIDPSLLRWFHAIGLPIAEVYGQTEDCGPSTLNPPGRIRIGTVGRPLPGVDVRLAPDGEVLVRGGNVCAGYADDPEATAQLIDDLGWMHSGDLGALDGAGYLSITGRKKDLIITASGTNIAPQEIETRLRSEPLLSQAVVVGDRRPYLTALLTLDVEAVTRWAEERGRIVDMEGLASDPDLLAEVAASVERVNAEHARVEGIKRWHILSHDFTMAADELTPTLKVKRGVVTAKYAEVIDELYDSDA